MSKSYVKPLSLALGAALVGGLSLNASATSAFQLGSLGTGYMLAQAAGSQDKTMPAESKSGTKTMKHEEGKCGEGKCGAKRKAHEGHCGGDKPAAKGKEGSCGADKAKAKEGSCGGDKAQEKAKEGSCGGMH